MLANTLNGFGFIILSAFVASLLLLILLTFVVLFRRKKM